MGTYTTNYNLFMPSIGEQGWGDLVNGNFSTIDTAMKGLDTRVGTLETEMDVVEERVTVLEAGEFETINCTGIVVGETGSFTNITVPYANTGILLLGTRTFNTIQSDTSSNPKGSSQTFNGYATYTDDFCEFFKFTVPIKNVVYTVASTGYHPNVSYNMTNGDSTWSWPSSSLNNTTKTVTIDITKPITITVINNYDSTLSGYGLKLTKATERYYLP